MCIIETFLRCSRCEFFRNMNLVAVLAVATFAALPAAHGGLAGTERIVGGLSSPMYAAHAPGDADRLFIATRDGDIRIFDFGTNSLLTTPFVSVPSVLTTGEGGLLGLAFHPDYATNGKFYVYATVDNGAGGTPFDSRVLEYTVSAADPNVANPASQRTVLSIEQPQSNHDAGWIGFSPIDGYLYVPTGDGGSGYDSGTGHTSTIGNAQDLTNNLLGKVLRIDVNGDDFPADANRNYAIPADNPFVGVTGDDEIFDYGVRNPFRSGFDRATGDLWIGDVGQDHFEEVNLHPASVPGGINYGWKEMEGRGATLNNSGSVVGSIISTAQLPEYDYHQPGAGPADFSGVSVVGGFVYRGPDPTLRGKYLFGDAGTARFWMFDPADPENSVQLINNDIAPTNSRLTLGSPYSFGEDLDGNLYITSSNGGVFRILTDALTPGDFDGDGHVDGDDLVNWSAGFGIQGSAVAADGDANGDGNVDGRDFLIWQRNHGDSSLNVSAAPTSAAVPEPPTFALLVLMAACLYTCLRQVVGPRVQRR